MWDSVRRWQGLALIAMVASSTLWLAATGQLGLYVAPRHVAFAVIMSVIGLCAVVVSVARVGGHRHEDLATKWGTIVSRAATSLALAVTGALLVLPPATLSSATATQRDINSTAVGEGGNGADVEDADTTSSDALAKFSVLDWASLLRQTSDTAFYDDKPVDVVGFITADSDDPENMFYVSRFLITHCAIDAQPVGVPVYLENWESRFDSDQWVQTAGAFEANRSADSSQQIALIPDDIVGIDQPSDPYLY